VRTSDGNAAVGRLVEERGIAHRLQNDAVLVEPIDAGGVTVRFLRSH
jgi:hypothetical protein